MVFWCLEFADGERPKSSMDRTSRWSTAGVSEGANTKHSWPLFNWSLTAIGDYCCHQYVQGEHISVASAGYSRAIALVLFSLTWPNDSKSLLCLMLQVRWVGRRLLQLILRQLQSCNLFVERLSDSNPDGYSGASRLFLSLRRVNSIWTTELWLVS